MDLETKHTLWDGRNKIADEGDIVKIELVTEEVIIGVFDGAEYDSITINREGQDWTFELEDIQDISRM